MNSMPTISLLVVSRKNSKYLAKFLFGLLRRTDMTGVEVLCMLNEADDWNDDLVHFFSQFPFIKFFREDKKMGRYGLHEYFSELYSHATGEWIVYFCDDHFIILDEWQDDLRTTIKARKLDYKEPHVIVPRFDNVGTMNHILSRGLIDALDGRMGQSGWIDTYFNEVSRFLPKERIHKIDEVYFHDFTHDNPQPMSEEHSIGEVDDYYVRHSLKVGTSVWQKAIDADAQKIIKKMNV